MKHTFTSIAFIALSAISLLCPPALAQQGKLEDRLGSDDPAVAAAAVTEARKMLQPKNPARFNFKKTGLTALSKAGRHAEAAELAQLAILAWPRTTGSVEALLKNRIDALLAAGQKQAALETARSYFNLASMTGTADAISELHRCLRAVYPDDPQKLEQFRTEQQRGAELPADSAKTSARVSPLVLGIAIDPAPYDAVLPLYGDDVDAMNCKGNLLLMSGRVDEARQIFERLYETASDGGLAGATEDLARCIKAEDGTIGRANKFVLDLRPKGE